MLKREQLDQQSKAWSARMREHKLQKKKWKQQQQHGYGQPLPQDEDDDDDDESVKKELMLQKRSFFITFKHLF